MNHHTSHSSMEGHLCYVLMIQTTLDMQRANKLSEQEASAPVRHCLVHYVLIRAYLTSNAVLSVPDSKTNALESLTLAFIASRDISIWVTKVSRIQTVSGSQQ